jgi:hypothetical protein
MKILHANGVSFSRITAELNERYECGVSRNAVIGKCTRMGLVSDAPRKSSSASGATVVKIRKGRMRRAAPDAVPVEWNDALDALIIELHSRKAMRATQITHFVRQEFGTSPTAEQIFARLHELGVVAGIEDKGRKRSADGTPLAPMMFCDMPDEDGGVPIADHQFYTCHWPMSGDTRNMRLCGERLFHNAYCRRHTMIACSQLPRVPKPIGAQA